MQHRSGAGECTSWMRRGNEELACAACVYVCFRCRVLIFNSLITSLACTSFLLTHLLSESGYLFHLIRYFNLHLLLKCQESRTFSTLYSSALSTRSGGGLE